MCIKQHYSDNNIVYILCIHTVNVYILIYKLIQIYKIEIYTLVIFYKYIFKSEKNYI